MTKDPDQDICVRQLHDDELDAVTGGALLAAHFVISQSPGFSAVTHLSPILLPPSPC
jgi:hypothetical protein